MRHETVNGIDAEVAESAFERMCGLIGRNGLERGQGMRTHKIFNVNEHPFDPDKQRCVTVLDLPGGHGVVWDEKRGTLFALGYTNLYELAYAPETMTVRGLHRWDFTESCVDAWGHDLVPDGKGGYYFTNHAAVWRFDPETGAFTMARDARDVKSFSPSSDGDLMAIPRKKWWTDTLLVFPSGSSDRSAAREITLPGAKFYKARWMSGSRGELRRRRAAVFMI